MGLTKIGMLVVTGAIVCFVFQTRKPLPNNTLAFPSPTSQVIDSISKMESFLERFPRTYMVNYFIDGDGFLYLSNQRMGLIEGAINNNKVRHDMVFGDFNESEIDSFFYVMAYLCKNRICSGHNEPSLGKFVFSYGDRAKSESDSRSLMIVGQARDTLSTNFRRLFKVIDRKDNLILFGPKSARE